MPTVIGVFLVATIAVLFGAYAVQYRRVLTLRQRINRLVSTLAGSPSLHADLAAMRATMRATSRALGKSTEREVMLDSLVNRAWQLLTPTATRWPDYGKLRDRLRYDIEAFLRTPRLPYPVDEGFTQSFSAVDWAAAFAIHAEKNPDLATDQGALIGWFANALMRGFDERDRRLRRDGREHEMTKVIRAPWKLGDGRIIDLITPAEFERLPDGTELIGIDGEQVVKGGKEPIDNDTRGGVLAYGQLSTRATKDLGAYEIELSEPSR